MAAENSENSEAEVHKVRGNELFKAGKLTEAAEAYGLAIEADPENVAYWTNRSAAYLKAGDASAALADAEEAVRLRPGWAKGHHRRAVALQALEQPRQAAKACAEGLAQLGTGTDAKELKELRRLQQVNLVLAAVGALQGWWHGKVSEPLGGFDQEFHFAPHNTLRCVVYGEEMPGTYTLSDVEESKEGGMRGGVDITINKTTRVPYLFRIGGDRVLHLCCPMKSPEERPRSFDGPGYVAMRPGRCSSEDAAVLAGLSEGSRILQYLEELNEIVESRPSGNSTAGAASEDVVEKLEDEAHGSMLSSNQLLGEESLEDKAKRLAEQQKMAALRIKYTGDIEDAAQKLISGQVDAAKAYPDQAKELERTLRPFLRRRAEAQEGPKETSEPAKSKDAAEVAPVAAPQAAPIEVPTAAGQADVAAQACAVVQPAATAQPAAAQPARPPKDGCCQACFAGLSRKRK